MYGRKSSHPGALEENISSAILLIAEWVRIWYGKDTFQEPIGQDSP